MKKIYSLLALSIAFVSCSNNSFEEIITEETAALQIETSVLTRTTRATASEATGSLEGLITESVLPDNAQIGVSVYEQGKTTPYYGLSETTANNILWSQSGSAWTSATTIHLQQRYADIYAYFPYKANANVTAIAVHPGYTDFMYGKSTAVNKQKPAAAIVMDHALAMVNFTFHRTNYPGECKLENIALNGITATGTMNILNGEIANGTGTTNLNVKHYNGKGYTEGAWNNIQIAEGVTMGQSPASSSIIANALPFHALVLPATETDELKATVTIDKKAYEVSLAVGSGDKWERGKSYTYNVNISGAGLTVSSVTVNPWVSGGSADIEI